MSVSVPSHTLDAELVRDFLAAMGRMDLGSLGEMLAADATWWIAGDLPVSGLYKGRAAVMGEFLSCAAALFEPGSLGFEQLSVLTSAGSVIVEYVGTGVAANGGRRYRNTYCTVFECRDGKISAVRKYLDTAHVRQALYPTGAP